MATDYNFHEQRAQKSLKIIPLGGCEEIGKNCTLLEYQNEIVIIDCGVMFPDTHMHGVDLVIPDLTYLKNHAKKVKGLLLTHGHEDHIGAVPYLLKTVSIPIYARKFTLGLVRNKLIEHGLEHKTTLHNMEYRQRFSLGKHFQIEFLRTTHSIVDSCAILIKLPLGHVLHTGDFKIDHTPIDGNFFDFYRFAKLGEEGLWLLLSDSTNALQAGHTGSEQSVYRAFKHVFEQSPGRIFIATFASNINRIQIVLDLAKVFKKKVGIVGRSLIENIKTARKLKYLQVEENQLLLNLEEIKKIDKSNLVLITTGTQGEPMSALSLLAYKKHKSLCIEENDNIIISASVIPGNEKEINKIVNNLLKTGAQVTYDSINNVHVSGHGRQEEMKLMLSLTKPKFFLPIHGEYKQLRNHTKIAQELGIPKHHCQIMENGDIIETSPEKIQKSHRLTLQQVFVDGKGVGDVGNRVLQDRNMLSKDGIVVIIISLLKKAEKRDFKTEIISRGFMYMKESGRFFDSVHHLILTIAKNYPQDQPLDFTAFKNKVKKSVHQFFYSKMHRSPMLVIRLLEF